MADLGAFFTRAQEQVDQAVETAGTTVRIADVATTTGSDLNQTETVTNARTVPAILTVVGGGEHDVSPTLAVRTGDWRLILKSSEALPEIGQDVRVETCRDPRRVGDHGDVLGTVFDSTGAYTAIYVRPDPPAREV